LGLSGLAALVVVGGGLVVWRLERNAPGSNLQHWGDSLWWAMSTLTTVGYGEHFPVTLGGRLVAVGIMVFGIAIIGAVAAMVAFGFGHRFAQRLEAAVHQVEEAQQHAVIASHTPPVEQTDSGLQEIVIALPDADCAASLTWLLARLGWHPTADDSGLGWARGGTRLRLAIRPWATPVGIQGRLTFGAGRPDRLARIAREALRHGFHRVAMSPSKLSINTIPADDPVILRTGSGFEVALTASLGSAVS
jgi:hypothetical protein